jgi:hypothetical protein
VPTFLQTFLPTFLQLLPPELQGAAVELLPYLLDSFGNATRIDYGTGHETTFVAFLYCLAGVCGFQQVRLLRQVGVWCCVGSETAAGLGVACENHVGQ